MKIDPGLFVRENNGASFIKWSSNHSSKGGKEER